MCACECEDVCVCMHLFYDGDPALLQSSVPRGVAAWFDYSLVFMWSSAGLWVPYEAQPVSVTVL